MDERVIATAIQIAGRAIGDGLVRLADANTLMAAVRAKQAGVEPQQARQWLTEAKRRERGA